MTNSIFVTTIEEGCTIIKDNEILSLKEYLELLEKGDIPKFPLVTTITLKERFSPKRFLFDWKTGEITGHLLNPTFELWQSKWSEKRIASNEEKIEIMQKEGIKTLKDDLSIIEKDYSYLYRDVCPNHCPIIGQVFLLEYNALSNYVGGRSHEVLKIEGEKALLKDVGILKKIKGELEVVDENRWFPLSECWEIPAALRWEEPFLIDPKKEIYDLMVYVREWFRGKKWNEVSFCISDIPNYGSFQWFKNDPVFGEIGEIKDYLHIYRHSDYSGYGPIIIKHFRPFSR